MSSTPRKSSIASRRGPPASLRIPSAARKASNPHLSLIFAQVGSTVSSNPNINGAAGPSKSEEALSRQLDGDLGGRQMGLRSRRSSSATIRSVRTLSGVSVTEEPGTGLRSPPLLEEEERGEAFMNGPVAGPSRRDGPPGVDNGFAGKDESATRSHITGSRLNPKASSSWLRWNSPAPRFPKADKGKGKAKEEDVTSVGSTVVSGDALVKEDLAGVTVGPPLDTKDAQNGVQTKSAKSIPNSNTLAVPGTGISQATDPPQSNTSTANTTPFATPTRRGWWSRTPIPETLTPGNPIKPISSPNEPLPQQVKIPEAVVQPIVPEPDEASKDKPPQPSTVQISSKDGDSPIALSDKATETQHADSNSSAVAIAQSSGWFSYLSRKSVPPTAPVEVQKASELAPTSAPVDESSQPEIPSPIVPTLAPEPTKPMEETAPVLQPEDSASSITESTSGSTTRNDPQGSDKPGWGTYLYSFVATTPKPTAVSPEVIPSPVVPPVDTPEVQSVMMPDPQPSVNIDPATPTTLPVPENGNGTKTTSSSCTASPIRKASVNSTSGWLNYLAFRAGQKKITGSTIGAGSTGTVTEGRPSMEDVMDFSNDPDFPQAQPQGSSPTAPTTDSIPTGNKPDSKDTVDSKNKTVTNKSSALDVRKKRLSVSSARSASSLTPLASSPKPSSVIQDNKPPSTKLPSTSALPAPPQPPTIQPNLVIPSFNTTFNRPPRSLPPLPNPGETRAGVAAATSGLAWKALSVAGSYVYGGSNTEKVVIPETAKAETRGMKEGRNVGGDLPRRVGLDGGDPSEGWRDVTRVVVVGVHGWFPAKMLNSVIGEPTGTSTKFSNMMGAAVRKFFEDRGITKELRMTLMPLEGEGTVESRVDKLYKAYLSNPAWINELRRADAIFFAAHSQGCIVTTHLISRMIAQGHIRTPLNREAVARCEWAFGLVGIVPQEPRRGRKPAIHLGSDGGYQKVAMLAMCGVHLGPMYSISTSTVIQPYLQWFENAAARELFEFQHSDSAVSAAYQKAFSMILENGVRMVLLAGLNDQVVPIYGASFSTATHPLILRALYVDGASYSASDFMTNLLCFAFMLRNAGIDDQRLVEHLSEATAGSLTGIGHSAPYEESACYTLAVEYLFNSGQPKLPIPPVSIESFSVRDARNDFELPWIMRAIVDSPEVKDLFPDELRDLKEGVVNWKPITKALKEIKKRLEPMAGRQSKLRQLQNSPSSTSLSTLNDGSKGSVGKGKEARGPPPLGRDW